MQVIDYIKKCVKWYVDDSNKKDHNLTVWIIHDPRYYFVQMGGCIFIPNNETESLLNGFILRTTDVVEGWEEFEGTDEKIPHIKEIIKVDE